MGLWKKEVVKIDGHLFCYVENQDDWTGQITNGIRKVKNKNGRYYVLNMGQRLDLTEAVNRLQQQEEYIKKAVKWYEQTNF